VGGVFILKQAQASIIVENGSKIKEMDLEFLSFQINNSMKEHFVSQ
jgi:hypothetical protein